MKSMVKRILFGLFFVLVPLLISASVVSLVVIVHVYREGDYGYDAGIALVKVMVALCCIHLAVFLVYSIVLVASKMLEAKEKKTESKEVER